MSQNTPASLLLNASEAAQMLGVSVRLIRKLIGNGTLPAVRIGRLVRIPASDVHSFVESRRAEVD